MTLDHVEDDYNFRQLKYQVEDLTNIVKKLQQEIKDLKKK
jgi:hypothetical protein